MGERSGQKTYWWQEERVAAKTAVAADDETDVTEAKTSDSEETVCLLRAPKPGDVCPSCGRGILDYDSLFMLVCDACGEVADAGCFS